MSRRPTQHAGTLLLSHHKMLWLGWIPREAYRPPSGDIQRHGLGIGWGDRLRPRPPALGGLPLLEHHPQLPFEVGELLEVPVHAGEAHVRDVVDLLQLGEQVEADVLAGDLGALLAETELEP